MLRGRKLGIKHVIAVVLLAVLLAAPLSGNPYYLDVMNVVGIHTMVAVGLCLIMGYTGQVSLGHAAFYGIGAFISGILSATYHVPPLLALVIAVVATGIIAFFTALPIFRLKGNYLAMATLGFGISVYILFREAHDFTGGPSGLRGIPYMGIGGFEFDNDLKIYYLVWAVCLSVLVIARNIVNSRTGRALRAIHGSEEAAASLGIDVDQFKVKVFVIGAVFAALAGAIYAHKVTFVSPQPFDFLFSVRLVVMAVLGGLASIWGAIFGTAVTTILSQLLHGFGELDTIAFGLILMVVMIYMPQGLTRGLIELYESGKIRNLLRRK